MLSCFRFGTGGAAVSAFVLSCGAALAAELQVGDEGRIVIKGAVTLGTAIRADTQDSTLIPAANATAIGLTGSAPGGRNSDDGNLNYRRGDRVSTVLKGFVDADFKSRNIGGFVRVKAWRDFALQGDDRPWGNIPNGYAAGKPLSDNGFSTLGQFSGISLMDAYAYGSFKPGNMPLDLRFGNQTIAWGERLTIAGGLSDINPVDAPARVRPGALPEETRIPFPALFARLGIAENVSLEGFYQLKWRRSQSFGCGTFFSTSDFTEEGCDKVFIGGNDRTALATGSFIKRAPDVNPSDSGQFGLGATYKAAALKTDFGVYLSQFHSRVPAVSAVKTLRPAGAPFVPGDPGGLNPKYFIEYPEDIRMLGLNFTTRASGFTLAGEATLRSNQPIRLNAQDILNAFASATAATPLRADATATPLGGVFHGHDRFNVSQFQLAASKPFQGALGASSLTLSAEVGLTYVSGLPDPNVRRYGRSDIFGSGAVAGVCPAGASSKQCSSDGFVSKSAWGYRLRAAFRYPGVAQGLDLLPSVTFRHDVKGWSYDGVFNEGRQSAILALRAEYRKAFMAEIAWFPQWGGPYSITKDRDVLSMSVGWRF